jgi:hypothetical protein
MLKEKEKEKLYYNNAFNNNFKPFKSPFKFNSFINIIYYTYN